VIDARSAVLDSLRIDLTPIRPVAGAITTFGEFEALSSGLVRELDELSSHFATDIEVSPTELRALFQAVEATRRAQTPGDDRSSSR
jgi:hypothetical protein